MNQKKRILIVDDDPDFAAAISKILTTAHYEVEQAGSLQGGMKAIEERKPDLILLDVMMEKYDDGFNMCYDLKHDERYKHIPVIMITAVTEVTGLKFSPDTDGEYLQAEGYLRKPVNAEVLLERVASLV
jgi:two-component system alkaline phosphatase synthesis response regulator PhoP